MKYNTVIAAALAAGVSADDWNSWTSSMTVAATSTMSCPATVTQTVTESAECADVTSVVYQTTITVEAPKTRTVTVYGNGQSAKNFWDNWTFAPAAPAPTSLPRGCVPEVVTATETAWNKKPGSTTTVTKSTLFVGPGEAPATTITITESGAAPAPAWETGYYGSAESSSYGGGYGGGYGSGSDSGSESGGYGQVAGGNWGDGGNLGPGPELYTAPGGLRIPVSETIIETGTWKWPAPPTNTKSCEAPSYTQRPDGSYGWGDWTGEGDNCKDPGSGNGGPGGNGGHGNNGTYPGQPGGWNITAGAPGSNVTVPILPLQPKGWTNSPDNRQQWVDGKDIHSNYYESYFSGQTCSYDLTITRMSLNLDGDFREVMAVNGQYPGPAIECNWGDMVSVTVHNELVTNGTSIHWHGVRQLGTNNMDGVPGLTECPLAPGTSKTYQWVASSYGSSWYHSHWIAQYGDGVFGPIIIHGPASMNYDYDMGAVMVSDLFNNTAFQEMQIINSQGPKITANWLLNGHNTKWDLSSGQHTLWSVEKGKKYLFRFVNAAAQSAFSISLDQHTMNVIAGDFVPITPYTTTWLDIGIGQRYDVVIEMDQEVDSYFLRAVSQLGCPGGSDNTGLGSANGIVAYQGVPIPYQLATSTTDKTLSDFEICQDEPLASLVPVLSLPAGSSSAFQASASKLPVSSPALVQTSDDGAVFKWFLNNGALDINYTAPTLKLLSEGVSLNSTLFSNPITLQGKEQWYYFVIQNLFTASHPMHLHGHDFSLLGQGLGDFDVSTMMGTLNFDSPMRRDTAMLMGGIDGGPPAGATGPPPSSNSTSGGNKKRQGPIPESPSGYTVIGFQTDNPGAWLMHCHIVWHVDEGLAVQWIERPADIPTSKYVDAQFEEECSAYENYQTIYPEGQKFPSSSGLRRRSFFDDQISKIHGFQFDQVVRRAESPVKQYLDHKRQSKRSFGDGSHPRHGI